MLWNGGVIEISELSSHENSPDALIAKRENAASFYEKSIY